MMLPSLLSTQSREQRRREQASENDEEARALCLMVKCVGVLMVRECSVLMSGANLLTAAILLVSLGQWAAGALGYQLSTRHQNVIKETSICSP